MATEDRLDASMSRLKQLAYRVGDPLGDWLLSPPRTAFGNYVNHGPRDRRRIALTFDDGPSVGSTDRLLDVLEKLGAPATFFCVGENVRENPDLVARTHEQGHDIGNHSARHARGAGLSLRDSAHIELAEEAIAEIIGTRPALYRPPWGWLTPWEARRLRGRGYSIIGWDVYTLDWEVPAPPPPVIVDGILRDVRPGSIVCLHDAFPLEPVYEKRLTADVVLDVVPKLRDDGFEFVTVSSLLGVPAFQDEAGEAA